MNKNNPILNHCGLRKLQSTLIWNLIGLENIIADYRLKIELIYDLALIEAWNASIGYIE